MSEVISFCLCYNDRNVSKGVLMMSGQEWFSSTIMNRGLDYYKRGRVTSLQKEENGYSAIVRGSVKYHVSIAMQGNKVSTMHCDCPYAKDGKHCKHEAAVMLAIEDELDKEEIAQFSELTLKKFYMKLQRKHSQLTKVHDIFTLEVKSRTEKIKKELTPYNKESLEKLTDLLNQFIALSYPERYRNDILDIIFNTFIKVASKSKNYREDVQKWIIKDLSEGIKEIPLEYYFALIELYKYSEQTSMYMKILLSMKYDSRVHQNIYLAKIYDILNRKVKVESSVIIQRLNQFSDLEYYQKLVVREYIKEQKYQEAKEYLELYKSTHLMIDESAFKDIEDELFIHLANRVEYAKQIIDKMKKRKNNIDYTSILKLKDMYGDEWEIECFDFFEQVSHLVSDYHFRELLKSIKPHRYIVSFLMEHLEYDNLIYFRYILEDYDATIYEYLYAEFIIQEAKKCTYQSQLYYFETHLHRFLIESGQAKRELINTLINQNKDKKGLVALLENVLDNDSVEGDRLLYDEGIIY